MLIGMALGIMAAVVWASYGIAQKVLLRTISPGRIMRFIYLAGALALTPLSTPSAFLELDSLQTACLIFACINTIVAYGAFSTAMKNWHAAKVSAVVTTTPLFTLGLEALGALFLWSTWACSACWELSSSCWGPWASRLAPCCTCRTSVPELRASCWRDRCRGFFLRCGTKRPAFSPGNTGPFARQLQLDSARQTALQDTTRARSSVG